MPRHPDPDLEDRILSAAQRLWTRGGEKSLTMRAVARAARTNTPAVYRRFETGEGAGARFAAAHRNPLAQAL